MLIDLCPVYIEVEEPSETQRDSSGQAVMAGVGEADGDGESLRNDGWEWSSGGSGVVSMIADLQTREFRGCVIDYALDVPSLFYLRTFYSFVAPILVFRTRSFL
jgi:hypothetical protein